MPSYTTEYADFSAREKTDNKPTDKETADFKLRLFSSVKGLASKITKSERSVSSNINYETIRGIGRFEELREDHAKFYDTYDGQRREMYFSEMDIKTLYLINESLYQFYMNRLNYE